MNACAGVVDACKLAQIVRELRTLSRTRLFAPPLEWAVRSGFEIALVDVLPADHAWDGTTVFHVHVPDRRWRGWGEYLAFSRALLARRGVAGVPADVQHLALLVAVPMEVRSLGVERIAEAQPHCPREVIHQAVRSHF